MNYRAIYALSPHECYSVGGMLVCTGRSRVMLYARSESSPVCAEMIAAVQADIRDSHCTGGHM